MTDEPVTDNVASDVTSTGSVTERVRQLIPLCATLDIQVHIYEPGQVRLALDWALALCTGRRLPHGGIVMALAYSASALCAYLNQPVGARGTATIEAKTNFLATVRAGTALASAGPLHVGSRSASAWSSRCRSACGR